MMGNHFQIIEIWRTHGAINGKRLSERERRRRTDTRTNKQKSHVCCCQSRKAERLVCFCKLMCSPARIARLPFELAFDQLDIHSGDNREQKRFQQINKIAYLAWQRARVPSWRACDHKVWCHTVSLFFIRLSAQFYSLINCKRWTETDVKAEFRTQLSRNATCSEFSA